MTQAHEDPSPEAGSDATETRKPGRLSRGNTLWLIAMVLVVAVIAALNLIHVPYVILRPGPATNTLGKENGKEVIAVSGVSTYPTSGSLYFTTVSMSGGPNYPVSVMDYLKAKYWDDHAHIDPEDIWFPKGVTGKQVQQQSASDMIDSQQTAEAVALRGAGYQVPETISVAAIADKAPAKGVLQEGDVLVKINTTTITDLASVSTAMSSVKAGDKVAVQVKRSGKDLNLQVPTAQIDGKARFGIGIQPKYSMPFKVTVNAGDVGGPSAGMMFSLAIYDKITPGQLTGGKKIAGTGTIAEDGSVGMIGGIQQKVWGAKDAGAKFFLAPAGDCSEVVGHVPSGLTVIRVSTFHEAVTQVKAIAAGKTTGFPACTK